VNYVEGVIDAIGSLRRFREKKPQNMETQNNRNYADNFQYNFSALLTALRAIVA